jgi:protein-S-isoprenylcysteine O-methyltransferase Ste14
MMTEQTPQVAEPTQAIGDRITWRQVLRLVVYLLACPAVLFISAGRVDWVMGWVYSGLAVGASVISRLLVARKNPDLLLERGSADQKDNVQPGDRLMVSASVLYIPIIALVVAGLDRRFGWSPPIPSWATVVALAGLLVGYTCSTWAMVVNRFFSAYVRIQSDRGHQVVSAGPYRFIRHPGYAGGILGCLAGPFVLGSYWACIPALAEAVAVAWRTSREDRYLQEGLPGYAEYARRTPYKLLPWVW